MRRNILKEQLRKEKRRRNIIFLLLSILVFSFLFYSFFFGEMGYIKYRQLKNNEQKLVKEINEIYSENKALRGEIELLKKDPAYLEKYAREKFGLVKPGEMVFQFKDEER